MKYFLSMIILTLSILLVGCSNNEFGTSNPDGGIIPGIPNNDEDNNNQTNEDNIDNNPLDDIVINQWLLQTNHKKVGYSMDKPLYIVIHNTANNMSAWNEVNYLHSKYNTSYTSFHYAVDENEIWQAVPNNFSSWHAGDGDTVTSYNRNSIGIEIARSTHSSIEFRDSATELAAKLTAKLMKEYNIPIENVVRHYDTSPNNKYCPHDIMDRYGWDNFLTLVESYL